jgi:hypothetical protein
MFNWTLPYSLVFLARLDFFAFGRTSNPHHSRTIQISDGREKGEKKKIVSLDFRKATPECDEISTRPS